MIKSKMMKLFYIFTSQKPVIRQHKQEVIMNSELSNIPIWVQFRCSDILGVQKLRQVIKMEAFKKKFISLMHDAPHGTFIIEYHYDENSLVRNTFSNWKSLTAKDQLPKGYPLMESIPRGLTDIFHIINRVKNFHFSDAILLSYSRDIRFVLFLSIFFGFTIWMCIAPDQLLDHPLALCSPNDKKWLINVINDTYISHICSSHPEVLSPCDCGEPLNQTVRDLFPQKRFDPLHISNQSQIKTVSLMVATIILSIALTESISQYGVYMEF